MKKSIKEIKEEFQQAEWGTYPLLLDKYKEDERVGVKKIRDSYEKNLKRRAEEKRRMKQMWTYEQEYVRYQSICGIDEAGRGPLAGPVVAGAVIFPRHSEILYLDDSKKLSEKMREELYEIIMEKAIAVGVGIVSPARIDEINILQATYEAMRIAVSKLSVRPDLLLNDAVTIPGIEVKQVPIIKGDSKSASIAGASIVAKVTRDSLMREYDKIMPEYGFASHKGYGSVMHIEALKKYGPSPIHRASFINHIMKDIKL